MKFRRIQVFMGHLEVGEVADLLKGKQKHWAVVQLAPVSYQLYSTELVARTGVNIAKKLYDIVAHTGVNITKQLCDIV
jgi:hypothetical protein